MRIGVALCLLAIVSSCQVAVAQLLQPKQLPKVVSISDDHGILQAMRAGDAERLNVIRKTTLPPYLRDFANAAYFRSLFRLEISSEYARKCYEYGMQFEVLEKNPVIAAMCGELLAGNLNMEGNVSGAAKMLVETERTVLPVIRRITGRPDIVLSRPPAEPFTGTAAANRVFQSGNVNVPRIGPNGSRNLTAPDLRHSDFTGAYLVMVKINGADRPMALDTGSTITILRSSTARAVGIEANPSPYLHFSNSIPIRPKTATVDQDDALLGVARQAYIGSSSNAISLRGIPVAIGGHFDLLGMNILSQMDSLYITAKGVTVNPQQLPVACEEPLEVASTLQGDYIPLLRYTVDGVTQQVAFDSGSMSYVTGTSLAPTTQRTGLDVTEWMGDVAGVYKDSYVPVRAALGAGSSAQIRSIKVFPSYKASFRYVLGVKVLRDFNVFFDFKHGNACLEQVKG